MPNERRYILDTMKQSKQPIARELSLSPPAPASASPTSKRNKISSRSKGKMRALSIGSLSDDPDIDFNLFEHHTSTPKVESDAGSSDIECSEIQQPSKNYVPPPRPRSPSFEIIGMSGVRQATNAPVTIDHMSFLKRKVKVEDDDDPFAYSLAKRPRVIKGGASSTSPTGSASHSSVARSPMSLVLSSPPSSHSSPQVDSRSSPALSQDRQPQWPGSMYTSDLLRGFRKVDSNIGSIEDRFKQAFPDVRFVRQTYYDARTRLSMMAQKDIDRSVAAIDTPKGLWSRLAKLYPLKST